MLRFYFLPPFPIEQRRTSNAGFCVHVNEIGFFLNRCVGFVCAGHWNGNVQTLAKNLMNLYMAYDSSFYNKYVCLLACVRVWCRALICRLQTQYSREVELTIVCCFLCDRMGTSYIKEEEAREHDETQRQTNWTALDTEVQRRKQLREDKDNDDTGSDLSKQAD